MIFSAKRNSEKFPKGKLEEWFEDRVTDNFRNNCLILTPKQPLLDRVIALLFSKCFRLKAHSEYLQKLTI